jgi:disulfide bond formation protein DsbB
MKIIPLPLIASIGAASALAVAFFSQYVLGAHPCELCILQRYPYAAVIVSGILAWVMRKRRLWVAALLAVCVLGFLTTSGIAAYHVAVEQKWMDAPDSCASATLSADASLDELKAMILNAPKVSCADVGASFAGISMATWNMLYGASCATLLILLWRKQEKTHG